jgi:hypothetical protein
LPPRSEVDRLDRQLRLFKSTLEVWLDVQRGWMALEPVFVAPDIQRQLPADAHAFVQVRKECGFNGQRWMQKESGLSWFQMHHSFSP